MSMDAALALRLLGQVELPGLSDTALEDEMERLIRRSHAGPVPVASICIWPSFISLCASRLAGKGVSVASVINFPKGGDDVERAIADAEEAIKDGADEIDLVFPAASFLDGEEPIARSMIAEVKDVMPEDALLKVILEPAHFADQGQLATACNLAIEEGADFLKAGGGRGARASNAQIKTMLTVIRETGKNTGLVVTGEFANLEDLRSGFDLASSMIGEPWANIDRFRISTISGIDLLLGVIQGAGK
jgi:deoxyribose-phosphate aldolase